MPSPNNTNYEGLYIAKQTPLGPELAFDSKPRRARDDEPDSAARGLANILIAVREALGEEDFKELCARVCGEDEPEPEAEDDDPASEFTSPEAREMDQLDAPAKDKKAKDKKAKDAPPPFEGMPKTHAEDSANDPRFDYLRDAAKVKPSTPGNAYGDVSSRAARNGATSKSFDAMYPHAAKVQVR
jgi:hypothetical protein